MNARRFLLLTQRFLALDEQDKLLLRIGRTFEPTRSGTGSFPRSQHTHASGQGLPVIRTLSQPLDHGSQARLRTFPHMAGDRGDILFGFEVGEQEGRVQVALHGPTAAFALVPALRSGLLHIPPTLMTILAQFGLEGGNFVEGAASFCNYAGQMRYKHPRRAKSDTFAILLLPAFE